MRVCLKRKDEGKNEAHGNIYRKKEKRKEGGREVKERRGGDWKYGMNEIMKK